MSLHLLPQTLLCCPESSASYAQTQLEDPGGADFQHSTEASSQTLQHLSVGDSQEHSKPFSVVSAESSAFYYTICISATHIHADFLFSFSDSVSLLLSSQFFMTLQTNKQTILALEYVSEKTQTKAV